METPWIWSLAVLYGNGQSQKQPSKTSFVFISKVGSQVLLFGGSCLRIVSSAAFHGNSGMKNCKSTIYKSTIA